MENVRGRELVERGALCERKNGRGVDPNRNWGVHWGHKEADYDPSEEYPGTAPFRYCAFLGLMHGCLTGFGRPFWVLLHGFLRCCGACTGGTRRLSTTPRRSARVLHPSGTAHCGTAFCGTACR